jgi:phosphoribosyl 1,2-cyclic phosphodiesterase
MDGTRCFPVPFSVMGAEIDFRHVDDVSGCRFRVGSVQVEACPTNHPGGCLAYAFETDQGKVVFLSDHETGCSDEPRILEFIQGSRLLIADAQYDATEITTRRGWGHGSVDEVVDLAAKAEVKELCLFHHDPTHSDDTLDSMLEKARDSLAGKGLSMTIHSAQEGAEIYL